MGFEIFRNLFEIHDVEDALIHLIILIGIRILRSAASGIQVKRGSAQIGSRRE